MQLLPACFFPTTILLVDDNTKTLDRLCKTLDHSTTTFLSFIRPQEALKYSNTFFSLTSFMNCWLDSIGNTELVANIAQLREQIYRLERFQQVSTMVIDYDMPGINGLELCAQIPDPHIQKILLTGAADETIAIKAFNEGLIHHFIQKQDPQVLETLDNYIHKSQYAYFDSISKTFMSTLTHNKDATALADPVFIKFFHQFLKDKNITEYYLIDSMGSFLFLNAYGKPSALFIYSEEIVDILNSEMVQEGRLYPHKTPPLTSLLEELEGNHKIVMETYLCKGENITPEQWPCVAYDLEALVGNQTYRWAYVPEVPNMEGIVSFQSFNSQLDT